MRQTVAELDRARDEEERVRPSRRSLAVSQIMFRFSPTQQQQEAEIRDLILGPDSGSFLGARGLA